MSSKKEVAQQGDRGRHCQ